MTGSTWLLGILLFGALQDDPVPDLSARVVDEAAMLTDDTRTRIERDLRRFEEATGAQLIVLTLPSLDGRPIEAVALEVGRSWKLGREDHDDGVLFLIAPAERKARIEVGRGLEADLPDARVGRILRDDVIPFLREGDFDGGVERGVAAVIAACSAPPPERLASPDLSPASPLDDLPLAGKIGMGLFLALVLTFVTFVSLFLVGGKLQFLFVGLFGSMCSLGLGALLGIPYTFWIVYLGAYAALLTFHRMTGWAPAFLVNARVSTAGGSSWNDDDHWSSSTSGGSSEVSGGGGSFGGGGASEDW